MRKQSLLVDMLLCNRFNMAPDGVQLSREFLLAKVLESKEGSVESEYLDMWIVDNLHNGTLKEVSLGVYERAGDRIPFAS